MLRQQQEEGQQQAAQQVEIEPPTSIPESHLLLVANGRIESLWLCGNASGIICRYALVVGKDWKHIWGLAGGLSQEGYEGDSSSKITLNFPFHAAFKGTSPHGWPRIAFCIYGRDWLGRQVVAGYAHTAIPLQPGRHQRRLAIYSIVESSTSKRFIAWLRAQRAEFIDLHTAAKNHGREAKGILQKGTAMLGIGYAGDRLGRPVQTLRLCAAVVRVEGVGEMTVEFQVLLRGAEPLGYSF